MTNELCKLQVMGKGGILGGARLRNGLEPFRRATTRIGSPMFGYATRRRAVNRGLATTEDTCDMN